MSIVEVTEGTLRGVREDGLHVFRGVPYASPPVADLRWRAALPHPGWVGVRDAVAYGPSAPQFYTPATHPILGNHGLPPFDEDCLTLNVWTPEPDGSKPVLVWIHGGGFMSGSGNLPIYAGDAFARNGDLVAVSINYRIGPLGYLHGVGDPNVWMSDQVAALRWIKENIARFGGDPANVTVVGQSGGALSIAALTEHSGLFERAILQSPPLGLSLHTPAEALERTQVLMEATGVDDAAGLRDLPWERLIEGTMAVMGRFNRPGEWPLAFVPVLERHPLDVLAETEIDFIIGATKDEATFAFAFGGDDRQAADRITKEFFLEPLAELARRRSAWFYQFDLATPACDGRLGATHCLELPFTFGNAGAWAHAPMMEGLDPAVVEEVSAAMHQAWIAFARTGDPSHDGLRWSRGDTIHFG